MKVIKSEVQMGRIGLRSGSAECAEANVGQDKIT